jgi:myo-inositol 2-dehydrogenase/D-chiro-inositol 1-dehydrogenase
MECRLSRQYYRRAGTTRSILASAQRLSRPKQSLNGSSRNKMNVLILGNGAEELAWARWVRQSGSRLQAVFPPFPGGALPSIPVARDLDDALARAGIDVVIVGGPLPERGEFLRRAAAEGLAVICLHPPGSDSEAYYQVALSREETGAVIVPDMPLRLHPGVAQLRQAMTGGDLGAIRSVRLELPAGEASPDLCGYVFARGVDVLRALAGEIEALTASGDPPGEHPDLELVVQLRSSSGHRAELRTWAGAPEPARLSLLGANGSAILEFDPNLGQPARLIRRATNQPEESTELHAWEPHEAIFSVLMLSRGRRGTSEVPSPNLLDGTRAMELAEATARSLRRGRTIDLYYEAISEESTFKSVMTSTGCVILMIALFLIPIALAGPPLGFPWTIYIAYLIPPVLVVYVLLQGLRLAVRRSDRPDAASPMGGPKSRPPLRPERASERPARDDPNEDR